MPRRGRLEPALPTQDVLSERVYAEVLDRLLSGSLPPDRRIGESAVAMELGCSRTPLREALLMLERDGMTIRIPERGFFAAPVRESEVREVYPVLAALEQAALNSAKDFLYLSVPRLKESNKGLSQARNVRTAVRFDTQFHQTLLEHCQNRFLKALIEKIRLSVRRYELLFMKDMRLLARSVMQHAQVIERIQADDLAGATKALLTNWGSGMESLLKELRELDPGRGTALKARC